MCLLPEGKVEANATHSTTEWDEPEGCGRAGARTMPKARETPVISGDYVRQSDDGAHARRKKKL